MRLRVAATVALCVVGVALVPVGADAASCQQISDRSGDASDLAGRNESLDILSADIASDDKTITAVIRLKKLADTSPTTPQARNYYLLFSTKNPSARMFLTATLYQGGVARYAWGTVAPVDPLGLLTLYDDGYGVLNQATGFLDLKTNEIHISAPVAAVAAKGAVKQGSKLAKLQADAFYSLGVFIFEADSATGRGEYTAGEKSCVTPGK